MKVVTKIIITSFFLTFFSFAIGQNSRVLTLEECISIAMDQNYSIIISDKNLEIIENNVTLAPFLPTLSLTSRYTDSKFNNRNLNQTGDRERSTVNSSSINSGVSFNWRLFDGFNMFATREKQLQLLSQGEYAFKSTVENLVLKISSQFYYIISLTNQVNLLQEVVGISEIRYNQALTRYNIGSDSGLEFKQAKIYLNSDSSRLMLQQENLKNAYIELYNLMNIPFSSSCIIKDTICTDRQLSLDYVIQSAMVNNSKVRGLINGEQIALLDLKIAKSQRYPTLDLVASYNYNFSESQMFPSRFNEANGYNWGLSLSIPIFYGGEISRRVRNAAISYENSSLLIEKTKQDIESEIMQLFNMYNHNLRLIDFEEENRQSAYMNLDAAMEKYRLGSLSGIEFRDYQLSYLDASDRKLRAIYQAKVLELTLKLLAGDLF